MNSAAQDYASAPEDMDGTSHQIFRWEAASGLEHTCYACTTKMNNPKAKQTCYGVHSIPCYRYHQTMHAIGTSHNCFACIQADTMHENRHRVIAELVAQVKSTEEEESALSIKNRKSNPFTPPLRELDPNPPPPAPTAAGPHRGRRHPPAPLVIPDDQPYQSDQHSEDDNTEQSPSTASTTTPSTASSTTTPKLTKADARAAKRAAKSAKSQLKSCKNQTKLAHVVPVKATDVDHVATVLHGPSFISNTSSTADGEEGARHPLASDKSIEDVMERNRHFVSNIHEHKVALLKELGGRRKLERRERVKKQQQAAQRDHKMGRSRRAGFREEDDNETRAAEEEESRLIDAIVGKLGITPASNSSSAGAVLNTPTTPNHKRLSTSSASGSSSSHTHTRQALVAQLRVAIAEDLQKHENEQRHTLVRVAGFWRYVGRQVFDRMCKIGETIDWRTGAIKKASEEGGDDDDEAPRVEDEVEDGEVADEAGDDDGRDERGRNVWEGKKDDREPGEPLARPI